MPKYGEKIDISLIEIIFNNSYLFIVTVIITYTIDKIY